jgi:hypothetical protein
MNEFFSKLTLPFSSTFYEDEALIEQVQSSSGFEREAALAHMIRFPSTKHMHHIIQRLNDWVPNVRKAAFRAFEIVVASASPEELLRCWRSVENLAKARRANHETALALFRSRVATLLAESSHAELIDGENAVFAAFVFRCALSDGNAINAEYVTSKLCARHARVSALACGWLDRSTSSEALVTAIRVGCNSQHASTRQWALRQIDLLPDDEARTTLHCHLFEKNATVRGIAALKLNLSKVDHLKLAEVAIDDPLSSRGARLEAIRLISKLGDESHLHRLTGALNSNESMARAIAAEGILRLDASGSDELFASVVVAIDGRALRYFVRSCVSANTIVARDVLERIWKAASEQKRLRLISLVEGLGRWEAWCFVASVVQSESRQQPESAKRVAARLVRSQVFVKPTQAQQEIIRAAIERIYDLFASESQRLVFAREMRDNAIVM